MTWNNFSDANIFSFRNNRMEGYFKKQVQKAKLFQFSQFPKRYFVIDFEDGVMLVKHKCEQSDRECSKCISIPFKNITEVYMPTEKQRPNSIPDDCLGVIIVQTLQRMYVMCCTTQKQAEMFNDGFKYLIKKTQVFQDILRTKNEYSSNRVEETQKPPKKHNRKVE